MEITATHTQQSTLAKPVSVPDQKKVALPDRDNEKKGSQVVDDSVLLSKDGLRLAHSQSSQNNTAVPGIENGEQAQKVAKQAVSDIRTHSGSVESVYGNLSQLNIKLLFE